MSRNHTPAAAYPVEYVIPELEHLLSIAQHELDSHLNDHGNCTCCQRHWPCPTACLAAETLSTL